MLARVCVPLIFLTLRGLVISDPWLSLVSAGESWEEGAIKIKYPQTQQPFQVWVSANQGEGLSSSALTSIHLKLLTPLLWLIEVQRHAWAIKKAQILKWPVISKRLGSNCAGSYDKMVKNLALSSMFKDWQLCLHRGVRKLDTRIKCWAHLEYVMLRLQCPA